MLASVPAKKMQLNGQGYDKAALDAVFEAGPATSPAGAGQSARPRRGRG